MFHLGFLWSITNLSYSVAYLSKFSYVFVIYNVQCLQFYLEEEGLKVNAIHFLGAEVSLVLSLKSFCHGKFNI